jgi:putative ABC transport system permease protein
VGVNNMAFDIPGVAPPPNQSRHVLEVAGITAGYFETMGILIQEGRAFQPSDREGESAVAILSQAAASLFWPGESAIGKTLLAGDGSDAISVVGVADNVKIWSLGEGPRPYIYRPYWQGFTSPTFFVTARGTGTPGETAALIRDEARAIDNEIFLTKVGTLDDHLAYVYFLPRLATLLLSLVGGLALLLSCMGLYGMVSYGVSRRTRETGIRLAIGATPRRVRQLILKGGLAFVAAGAVIGIVASIGLGQVLEQFLYGRSGVDLLALLAAPIVLTLVASLATYLPARRASNIDPVRALRSE